MAKRFVSARWKIKRANKHIAEIDALVSSFHEPDAYTVAEVRNPKTGQKFIEYGFAQRISVEELALAIGDAIHNLKCALDYAWIGTIKEIVPAKITSKTKFPIRSSRSELQSALGGIGIQNSHPTLYNLIVDDIKPYDGGDDLLCAIHRMDIGDKHKLLIPLLDIGVTNLTIEDDKGDIRRHLCVFTHGGAYRKPIEENQKLKDKGDVSLKVVFQEQLPPMGGEVLPILHYFSTLVLKIVELLEIFLET